LEGTDRQEAAIRTHKAGRFRSGKRTRINLGYRAGTAAFLLTLSLLAVVHFRVHPPVLLLERFFPGWGWLQMLALALYAWVVAWLFLDVRRTSRVRFVVWLLFSAVFFFQLFLGLAGIKECLMTGELHLPVPAMILAGPLYRGEGLFMPLLFLATVLLVGPAWCSYLCYMGSWDRAAAGRKRAPSELAPVWRKVRFFFLFLAAAGAIALRWAGAPSVAATALGLVFGLAGVGVMAFVSRRSGVMFHCSVYCPIGIGADVVGRLSPFRLRFGEGCDGCGACTRACLYATLEAEHIRRRRPGFSCTLCGDCLAACPKKALTYRFPGLSPEAARTVFLVLAASLHALFLGVAKI